ncbi:hypothetical protein D3C71_1949470 [compost metagenome]
MALAVDRPLTCTEVKYSCPESGLPFLVKLSSHWPATAETEGTSSINGTRNLPFMKDSL